MSSVTTGEEIIRETPVVPVTWAALAGVIQLVALLGIGFAAYGGLRTDVDNLKAQGTPALQGHIQAQHEKEVENAASSAAMQQDIKYIKEAVGRIEKRLDRK